MENCESREAASAGDGNSHCAIGSLFIVHCALATLATDALLLSLLHITHMVHTAETMDGQYDNTNYDSHPCMHKVQWVCHQQQLKYRLLPKEAKMAFMMNELNSIW